MRKPLVLFLFIIAFLTGRAQTITVTAPNGGEQLYACQTYTITWTASGTSNYYDLDYSLNNGAIWASIASNINVTNGQYTWTIPNVESNTCLVRVRDKNNNVIEDISNAVFAIHIPVVVTAPNGGESWLAGSQHLITWNIQGTSLTFNLDYSTNNGSTWNSIVSNLSTSVGSYNWTVPNAPGTNYLVRVRDAVTNCMQDVSNNVFTVTPLSPVMTYPNGGEVFTWGQPVTITWNAATYYSSVRIEYSIDNGLTWTLINATVTNTGTYAWSGLPNVNSSSCLVKVSTASNVLLNDVSNATFSIVKPTITLTAPNGGEAFLGCNNYSSSVSLFNTRYLTSSYLYFDYSTDGGATWSNFGVTSVGASTATTSSATLSVPNSLSSTQCLVKVYSLDYPTMSDTSNAFFSIQPNNVVTVTSPNGGESFVPGSTTTITWSNTPAASGLYNVLYSTNNGSTWVSLATGVSGNSYVWSNIPNTPRATYLVQVQDAANTCRFDVSNANFTVTALSPVMTYPNGGEVFTWGQPVTITWNAATYYSSVRIEYSIDNGLTWTLINATVTNTGTYAWSGLPNVNSSSCLVKVSTASNVLLNDVSNATFSIVKPTITLTAPNGGEAFLGCNNYSSSVSLFNTRYLTSSYLYFDYSTDGGATWSNFGVTSVGASTATTSNATLSVPNSLSSTQCLVKVYSLDYPTMSDTSNAFFSIQPNNVVTVTSPNGGESFVPGSTTTITWSNTPAASGLYNVLYSTNNGSTWVSLATGVSGNSYVWSNIPNTPRATYLVQVQDAANTCRFDVSNATFTVTALSPVMTYPNGGEVFTWGQPVTITWNAATYYSSVRIEYSIDNGLTWTLINATVTNTGTYAWSGLPNVNSSSCLVKVSTASNVLLNDVSNATFSIVKPTITLTAPNGGEAFLGCNNYSSSVSLFNTRYLTSSYLYFDYSTDGGATWSNFGVTSVGASTATTSSATLSVPNSLSSTQCLVKVYSLDYPTMSDTSNAFFSIQPNNVVTVTSPNGGESFVPGSTTTITWSNTPAASGLYNVLYSTNNGSTWVSLATGVSGNSYVWSNIPNTPRATYLVQVQDAANTCRFDVSNANFTVTALSPVMTYPNGGEVFTWGQPVTITWNAATYYSSVRIEYSIDNGLTWTLINATVTNTGTYAWSGLPNVNSSSCLVKVSTASNVLLNDVSNATFSIVKPTITLTAPNGGEAFLGCNNYSSTVSLFNTRYLTSSYLYFDYSTDGGATWSNFGVTSVGASTATTSNATLSVPNSLSSTQCLVKVYSLDYPTMSDTSNAFFSIQPNNVVTVTSPNGGESFVPGSTTTITWSNTPAASGLYNVLYSTNNGSTWVSLATGVSGNSYVWSNIPNTPRATYLVQVQDAANTCRFDVSNATFTVTALSPVMTYPNGGEVFTWGQPVTITWNAATYYSSVRIEYSIDNGLTWTLINATVTNTGTYAWSGLPNVNSSSCLVKVSTASNVLLNDVSNATFSIVKPTITLTAPNGGEAFLGCNNYSSTVSLFNTRYLTSSYLYFDYSTDGGATWSNFGVTSVGASTATTSNATLSVPNSLSSTQCLVKVYSLDYPTMSDTSNAFFSIQPNNVVTVTSPNGGESFVPGSTTTITWSNTPAASGLYNVLYSTNNGSTWVSLATGVSGNSYVWSNIPNTPRATYLVQVQDAANTCRFDVSNATFTVTALSPVMTYPNGGEVFASLSTVNITWNASTYYSSVRIEYSIDNGSSWNLISSSTINDGTEAWTLPFANSTTCLVKVSTASNVLLTDVSNAAFSITPVVKITTPNGFDQLGACTQTSISFTHTTNFTSFDIAYSLDKGASWTGIVYSLTATGTTGSYNWTLPNIASTQALVRVNPAGSVAYADISDTTFTIKPAVTLIQPNFGGLLQVGTTYPIKWSSDGISNLYDLAYSTTGNAGPWTNMVIGYNTATNTYNWTVPNIVSTNCYIRVRDNTASCKEDISNLPFTISASSSPITILTSNGGDTLKGCQNYTITWTENGTPLGSYKVDLSPDGGITWNNIVSNHVTTAGTYNWVVPNINSDQALIRVASASVSTIYDVSDAAFVIQSRTVKATPDTIICTGAAVNLRATGGTGSGVYTWSPSNNLSNINIANPVATPTVSTNYVVTSANGSCIITDTASIIVQSAPVFTISSDAVETCGSQLVTFTANVTGGGTNPIYQWKRNSLNVGGNTRIFSINNLNDKDTISCILTYNPSCFAAVKSNSIVVGVIAKPNLGNDTVITVAMQTTTVNLNTLYNTTGLAYAVWNTTNPAAAAPGIYRLIVCKLSGCTCPDSDTAFVYINAVSAGREARACAKGSSIMTSSISGLTYQWQVNKGAGFENLLNDMHHSNVTGNQLSLVDVPSAFYGYQYRCLVNGSLFSDAYTLKITALWTGFANTDWENPANWGCGSVPDENTDVYIYNGKPNYPEINCNRICRSVNATQGTSLKVTDGKIFYIKGN